MTSFSKQKLTDVKKSLTHQQQQFIIEYCKDMNGVQAALRVGAVRAIGAEWMKQPHIREAVETRLMQIATVAGIDAIWCLMKRKQILETTMAEGDHTNSLRNIEGIEKLYLRMTEGFSLEKNTTITHKVELSPTDQDILTRLKTMSTKLLRDHQAIDCEALPLDSL